MKLTMLAFYILFALMTFGERLKIDIYVPIKDRHYKAEVYYSKKHKKFVVVSEKEGTVYFNTFEAARQPYKNAVICGSVYDKSLKEYRQEMAMIASERALEKELLAINVAERLRREREQEQINRQIYFMQMEQIRREARQDAAIDALFDIRNELYNR